MSKVPNPETTDAIDILRIATDRLNAAATNRMNTMYMQNSEQAGYAYQYARWQEGLAKRDLIAVCNLGQFLEDAANAR